MLYFPSFFGFNKSTWWIEWITNQIIAPYTASRTLIGQSLLYFVLWLARRPARDQLNNDCGINNDCHGCHHIFLFSNPIKVKTSATFPLLIDITLTELLVSLFWHFVTLKLWPAWTVELCWRSCSISPAS